MDETSDRELEAILKLIKLTQNGEIKWRATKPWGELVEDETTKYSSVSFCDYEGKRLRIFTERIKKDEPSEAEKMVTNKLFYLLDQGRAYPYWSERVMLEITNQEGQILWRFPYKPALNDLANAVKYNVAGVKDLLDSLLSNKSN